MNRKERLKSASKFFNFYLGINFDESISEKHDIVKCMVEFSDIESEKLRDDFAVKFIEYCAGEGWVNEYDTPHKTPWRNHKNDPFATNRKSTLELLEIFKSSKQ